MLFTTYISTLPRVLESLLERLAPDMVGRVDFMGVRAFAYGLLKERRIAFRVPGRKAQLALGDWAMVDRLTEVLRLVRTEHGGVGILTSTNRQADDVMEALRSAGTPTVSLQRYAGRSSDTVRVGTVRRAKGVDLYQVLLAHVDPGHWTLPRRARRRPNGSVGSGATASAT